MHFLHAYDKISLVEKTTTQHCSETNPISKMKLTSYLFTIHSYLLTKYAGVAELADAPDLGSGGTPVQVQVLSPAPKKVLVTRQGLFQ